MWQLHSLLRACNHTDQVHIITEVGLDPETYGGPSPPESDSEEGSQDDSEPVQKTDVGANSTNQPARTSDPLSGKCNILQLSKHEHNTFVHTLLKKLNYGQKLYNGSFGLS